ncbi:WhiB family transcriptional regulator [Actinomycetia phage DSL-LC01]|nr:WhiB family transcriptional regulator [Actinomycetia phage DSL-LC01]
MTKKIIVWQEHAACVSKLDLFFDETRKKIVKKAKAVCAVCPVKIHCLEHAIANDEIGIWGGMTTNERRKLLRARRKEKK